MIPTLMYENIFGFPGQQLGVPVHLPGIQLGNITSSIHKIPASSSTALLSSWEKLRLDDWLIRAASPSQAHLQAEVGL